MCVQDSVDPGLGSVLDSKQCQGSGSFVPRVAKGSQIELHPQSTSCTHLPGSRSSSKSIPFRRQRTEASFSREGPGVSPHLPHVPVRPSLGGASGIVPLGFGLGPEGMKARQESHPQPFPISRIWKVLPLWAPDQRAWGSFGTRSYCQVSLPSCLYHGLLHRTWFLP